MKMHYCKIHYINLHFLTPEPYPNYPLSHHPSSFLLTVENRGKPRLFYNSIFLMFAAVLVAARELNFHEHHRQFQQEPSPFSSSPPPLYICKFGFLGRHMKQYRQRNKVWHIPHGGRKGSRGVQCLKAIFLSVLPGI